MFLPSCRGLWHMNGNVGGWDWDYYGDCNTELQADPTGVNAGPHRVYRGGWTSMEFPVNRSENISGRKF